MGRRRDTVCGYHRRRRSDFPTSKSAIVNRARDNGGIDHEVVAVLSKLPDRSFESIEELKDEVRSIYLAEGEALEGLPV